MKSMRKKQKNVQRYCENLLREAERKAERESIVLIEAYKKVEKHRYRLIEKERAAAAESGQTVNHDFHQQDLNEHISTLKSELLDIEMKL